MPAEDTFVNHSVGADGPAAHAAVVTPSDGTDLGFVTRALIIGTAGNLAVVTDGGETVTIPNVPAGILPLRVSRVKSTGTMALNITALW